MGVTVTTNDTLTLNCTAVNNADAVTPLTFTWIRDSTFLQNPITERFMVNETTFTNSLIVANVNREDAGMYQCAVSNREFADAVRSAEAEVIINC